MVERKQMSYKGSHCLLPKIHSRVIKALVKLRFSARMGILLAALPLLETAREDARQVCHFYHEAGPMLQDWLHAIGRFCGNHVGATGTQAIADKHTPERCAFLPRSTEVPRLLGITSSFFPLSPWEFYFDCFILPQDSLLKEANIYIYHDKSLEFAESF